MIIVDYRVFMALSKRDIKNLAILKLYDDKKITEKEAFTMLILKQKSEKKKHKYIRKLIKILNNLEFYNGQEKN